VQNHELETRYLQRLRPKKQTDMTAETIIRLFAGSPITTIEYKTAMRLNRFDAYQHLVRCEAAGLIRRAGQKAWLPVESRKPKPR
jgi:hypothetical protein